MPLWLIISFWCIALESLNKLSLPEAGFIIQGCSECLDVPGDGDPGAPGGRLLLVEVEDKCFCKSEKTVAQLAVTCSM